MARVTLLCVDPCNTQLPATCDGLQESLLALFLARRKALASRKPHAQGARWLTCLAKGSLYSQCLAFDVIVYLPASYGKCQGHQV